MSARALPRLAAAPVLIALACPGLAIGASATLRLSSASVSRGHSVRVSGNVGGGCPAGDQVTLLSRAFSHKHDFAGVPAVYARVRAGGAFGVSTTIPAARRPGSYSVSARCGGGHFGHARLRVR